MTLDKNKSISSFF